MVSLPGVMRTPFCHGHEIAALPRHLPVNRRIRFGRIRRKCVWSR